MCPTMDPTTQVVGQACEAWTCQRCFASAEEAFEVRTCHDLSQSSGIGIAPAQQPIRVPMPGATSANSTSFAGLQFYADQHANKR